MMPLIVNKVVKTVKYTGVLIVVLALLSLLIYFVKTPSSGSKWSLGNGKNSNVKIIGDHVVINNFRDINWLELGDSNNKNTEDNAYRTLEFDLSELQSLNVVVSHFSALSEIAHLFILFELKDKTSFGLSVEARKEADEKYTLSGGLTAKFEVIYLLGSYQDLVGLRKMRGEDIYVYPIKAKPENVQSLFKVVANRTNQIHSKPELYHLFFKNCTTEIVKLVNKISDQKYPWFTQHFAPGDAGKALYKMDLIDIQASSYEAMRKLALVKN